MKRRYRRWAAVLLVVTAGMFVVGARAEGDRHSAAAEISGGHDESEGAVSGHDESRETSGAEAPDEGVVAGTEEGGDEARALGVDVESPVVVTFAVVASLALGAGLWALDRRWVALSAVGIAIAFAAFDATEVVRLLDRSRSGLALLAGAVALGHLGAAAFAAVSIDSRAWDGSDGVRAGSP